MGPCLLKEDSNSGPAGANSSEHISWFQIRLWLEKLSQFSSCPAFFFTNLFAVLSRCAALAIRVPQYFSRLHHFSSFHNNVASLMRNRYQRGSLFSARLYDFLVVKKKVSEWKGKARRRGEGRDGTATAQFGWKKKENQGEGCALKICSPRLWFGNE